MTTVVIQEAPELWRGWVIREGAVMALSALCWNEGPTTQQSRRRPHLIECSGPGRHNCCQIWSPSFQVPGLNCRVRVLKLSCDHQLMVSALNLGPSGTQKARLPSGAQHATLETLCFLPCSAAPTSQGHQHQPLWRSLPAEVELDP